MARYLQRISLLGKERWIGWEIDGVGTEVPGLMLADDLSEEEIRARGAVPLAVVRGHPHARHEHARARGLEALDDRVEIDAHLERDGGAAQHVHQVTAPEQRHLEFALP